MDLMDSTKTIVGFIDVPKTFGKFYAFLDFVENIFSLKYSQGDEQFSSCFVMGMQSSIFKALIGNNTVEAKQSTDTYEIAMILIWFKLPVMMMLALIL
ncbi:hypothetical protein [Bartonella koehlerae]|uniref:Uncharacterized protein n=2 Tax=Bartonella koehlerae TaxID=92181 RepID=A0A067W4B6_9HYPH|nr:hypothetical protein [Bartonella koehlerae]KEC54760.1 hypothetical protein O9A_01374 [Bartonella koehlerae C-29]